jgi:hypothetical protein
MIAECRESKDDLGERSLNNRAADAIAARFNAIRA